MTRKEWLFKQLKFALRRNKYLEQLQRKTETRYARLVSKQNREIVRDTVELPRVLIKNNSDNDILKYIKSKLDNKMILGE